MAKAQKASDGIAAKLISELSRSDREGADAEYVKQLSETYDRARDAERTLFGIWDDYLSLDKAYDKLQHHIGY